MKLGSASSLLCVFLSIGISICNGALGDSPQTTTTVYDNMGRPTSIIQPDGTTIITFYLPTGEIGLQYGSGTYPVGYSYDYAGRLKTMTNWSNFPNSGARVTTWNYDGQRGWLTNVVYDGISGPSYTYTYAGRLATRKWARNVTTTYGRNNAGEISTIVYSDGTTPNVTNTYDRLGRLLIVNQGANISSLVYNNANQIVSETFAGKTTTNIYDSLSRQTSVGLVDEPSVLTQYGYDSAARLSSITNGENTAIYDYVPNSSLVAHVTLKHNGITRLTITKLYDNLNRLTSISSVPSGTSSLSFSYSYNDANQRTRSTLADGSYWIYQYDFLGQVISGKKYWFDGTPVTGQQFEYVYDNIGNRTSTKVGGDANGGNLRQAGYAPNSLNQITSRDVSGTNDIIGVAIATNGVTVNGQTAYRKGEYFRSEIGTNNSSAPAWLEVTVTSGGFTNTGNIFIAKTPEVFGYDADGNMTNDGQFSYTWDAENRLTSITSQTNVADAAKQKVDCQYDTQFRRTEKIVSVWNGSSYVPQSTNKFVYDGWNLIAILNFDSSPLISFQWGTDLSGTMQGAGGIGGLISMTVYSGTNAGTYFYAYDGNGNVVALVNAIDGTIAAQYEYGPFGEPIRATGPLARLNPFLFSTKFYDWETGLHYYGYRYYSSTTGRFLNRDPLGELNPLIQGSNNEELPVVSIDEVNSSSFDPYQFVARFQHREPSNPFGFVANNPLSHFDPLGLQQDPSPSPTKPGKSFVIKDVTITHYCNCKICTGKSPGDPGYGQAADGTTACEGTVAADWSKIPKGSTVTWTDPDGNKITGVVHDKGGAIKGNHIDVWCKTHKEALNRGKYKANVTVTLP